MPFDLTRVPDGWEARFWARVAVRGEDECWLWQRKPANGRPQVALPVTVAPRGRIYMAYRVASALVDGPIADGIVVRHSCDVPMCCNPKHLLRGSQADNVRDAFVRGKFVSKQRRFQPDEIRDMRFRCSRGETMADVARSYGCWPDTVQDIVKWKHYKDVI